jgi:hypothetical protein
MLTTVDAAEGIGSAGQALQIDQPGKGAQVAAQRNLGAWLRSDSSTQVPRAVWSFAVRCSTARRSLSFTKSPHGIWRTIALVPFCQKDPRAGHVSTTITAPFVGIDPRRTAPAGANSDRDGALASAAVRENA